MNKTDVVEALRAKGYTKKDAEKFMEDFLDVVVTGVITDGTCRLGDLGNLTKVHRNERKGRNPQTGEEIHIQAKDSVVFKISKPFLAKVNGK